LVLETRKSTYARALPAHAIFYEEESMKARYSVALAIGCFALGAAAIQTLHAQAKPPAYVIGEIIVKDLDGYKSEYLPAAQKAIKESGGKYLAGGFNKTVTFNGAPPPNRVVVLQFESMDAAKAWDESAAQKESRKIGDKYATFRTFAVEGAEMK
jgi:uncharacterized protein (DUF1330 family)